MSVNQASHEAAPELGKTLASRHVTMITIGGIIGAGLFVGSSASISTVGPAVIVSYGLAGLVVLLVMRMLSEMAVAYPKIGAFTEYAREGWATGPASPTDGCTGTSGRSRRPSRPSPAPS